jgi:hypothetical protein
LLQSGMWDEELFLWMLVDNGIADVVANISDSDDGLILDGMGDDLWPTSLKSEWSMWESWCGRRDT